VSEHLQKYGTESVGAFQKALEEEALPSSEDDKKLPGLIHGCGGGSCRHGSRIFD
jgi:hypothetical protein